MIGYMTMLTDILLDISNSVEELSILRTVKTTLNLLFATRKYARILH